MENPLGWQVRWQQMARARDSRGPGRSPGPAGSSSINSPERLFQHAPQARREGRRVFDLAALEHARLVEDEVRRILDQRLVLAVLQPAGEREGQRMGRV